METLSPQTQKKSQNLGNSNIGLTQNLSFAQKYINQSPHTAKEILLDLHPISQIYEDLEQDIAVRGTTPKYPSGIDSLDKVLWGFHKQQLLTFGARTSMGKTLFAINIAISLARLDLKIVYFSLEMSKSQLLERIVTHVCTINNLKLSEGKAKQEFQDGKGLFSKWADENRLLIDDKYGYDFKNLIQVCNVTEPDFIIIDHIQMIRSVGFRSGKLEAIEEYIRCLKQLSLEWNFGIILLSQINRSGIDKPQLEHLKWGGILEELSDTVILMQTDWDKRIAHLNIAKQRHRGTAEIDLKIIPQYAKFEDLTAEEKETIEQETIAPPLERKDWQ